jgi:hypothetical protein
MANLFDNDTRKEHTMSDQTSTLSRFYVTAPQPAAPTATIDTSARTVAQPAGALALAWSAEEPEDRPDPLAWAFDDDASEPSAPWYLRPALLLAAAGALVVVALAGLALTLHSGAGTVAVPAVKSTSTPPSVPAAVAAPTQDAPPPPPIQTVIVDQVPSVTRIPQTSTHVVAPTQVAPPSSSPAPQPSTPTWTPKPIEHWPPYGKPLPPFGKSGTDHEDNTHHDR